MNVDFYKLVANGAKPEEIIGCPVCNVICLNEQQYRHHVISRKHTTKLQDLSYCCVDFHCALCDIYCTSANQLYAHCKGKKHAKMFRLTVGDMQVESHSAFDASGGNNVSGYEGDCDEGDQQLMSADDNQVSVVSSDIETGDVDNVCDVEVTDGCDVDGGFSVCPGHVCYACDIYCSSPIKVPFCVECYKYI